MGRDSPETRMPQFLPGRNSQMEAAVTQVTAARNPDGPKAARQNEKRRPAVTW